jgi:hypothetical protein
VFVEDIIPKEGEHKDGGKEGEKEGNDQRWTRDALLKRLHREAHVEKKRKNIDTYACRCGLDAGELGLPAGHAMVTKNTE